MKGAIYKSENVNILDKDVYIKARYSRISKIWTSRGQENKGTRVQKYSKKSLQIRLMIGIFGRAGKEQTWTAFNIKLGN